MIETKTDIIGLRKALMDSVLPQTVTISKHENKIAGKFLFSKTFLGFSGHFPGYPILPAVIQIAAVRMLAEIGLKKTVMLHSIERAKFTNIVQPGNPLTIQIDYAIKEASCLLNFSITSKNGQVAVGEINCRTDER